MEGGQHRPEREIRPGSARKQGAGGPSPLSSITAAGFARGRVAWLPPPAWGRCGWGRLAGGLPQAARCAANLPALGLEPTKPTARSVTGCAATSSMLPSRVRVGKPGGMAGEGPPPTAPLPLMPQCWASRVRLLPGLRSGNCVLPAVREAACAIVSRGCPREAGCGVDRERRAPDCDATNRVKDTALTTAFRMNHKQKQLCAASAGPPHTTCCLPSHAANLHSAAVCAGLCVYSG
jgi:hypothetical protein